MRTVYAQKNKKIILGRQGEDRAVRVVWPGIVSDWSSLYGDGSFQLSVRRFSDENAYPVVVEVNGDDIRFTVTSAETSIAGIGKCELTYIANGTIAKSATWETVVLNSLTGQTPSEPPEEPAKSWFTSIQGQIGNLAELATASKDNLVAAINEAAQSGGGGGASIELDTTLTQSGKAADAKAVGDALAGKQPKGDYLTQNELQSATNAALAQAKESGEFDGADGITPSIGNNGNWYIGTTDTGKPSRGEKGDPGDSPDMTAYRTAEAQDVIDAGKQDTLIQSGASVGQIAKITAVDDTGKPTAWQAVDMPSGGSEVWRYLGKFETSEEVSSIVVSKDADGNSFALKKVIVSGLIAANNAAFTGWMKMYDQNGTVVFDLPSAVAQNDGGTVVGRGFQAEAWIIAGTYHPKNRLEGVNTAGSARLLTVVSGPNGAFTNVDKVAAPEAITKLTGKSYGSTPWGAGSYLYVWGVDA